MVLSDEFNRKLCNHFIQLSVKELENKTVFGEVGLFSLIKKNLYVYLRAYGKSNFLSLSHVCFFNHYDWGMDTNN